MLKIIFSICVFMLASISEAASISTQKNIYPTEETITVTVSDMLGDNQDWIGIYPAGATNSWENVISWAWTKGINNGEVSLPSIADAGNYEARAFFKNSYRTESSDAFAVSDATLTTQKNNYDEEQSIVVSVSNMLGDSEDWIGIYPADATNDWSNVINWAWTGGIVNGEITLEGIANTGNYEARAFFDNAFNTIASHTFTIGKSTTISTQKETYNTEEPIVVSITNMLGDNKDWIGIYPADATNAWNNVVSWAWTTGVVNGEITLDGVPNTGNYEARAFFENSYHTEATDAFTVNTEVYPPNTQFTSIATANVQQPAKGEAYDEPNFPTTVTRVTDRKSNRCLNYKNEITNCNAHPYPKTQAWNSDMSILKLGYRFYQADSLEELAITKNINNGTELYNINGSLSEMKWSNVNPNTYYGVRSSRFVKATINGNQISTDVLIDFSAKEYKQFLLGKYEGNIDYNDQYVVFVARKKGGENGRGVNYPTIIVYNIKTNQVKANKDFPDIAWEKEEEYFDEKEGKIKKRWVQIFDWSSISPQGNHVLISATAPISAIRQYDLDLNFIRELANSAGHGDMGIDSTNHEVYVQFEFGANSGIWSYQLDNGVRTQLLPDKYNGGHVSCRNYKRPGWCYLSTHQEGYREVFALKLDNGSGTVNRFAQTHSSKAEYSAVNVSPDGTKVLFVSDFGDANAKYPNWETYMATPR